MRDLGTGLLDGGRELAEQQHLGGELHRHLVEALLTAAARQVIDRISHLDRIAGA
jgi:hypothetical protein